MNKEYYPTPLNTSLINLPEGLDKLIEKLAENAHDTWAKQRISEGWRYGEKRDDAARTHPDLVPYSQLTDSEQEYDRQAVLQTLKAIIALGYVIKKR